MPLIQNTRKVKYYNDKGAVTTILNYSPRIRLLELSSIESELAFSAIDSLRGIGGPKFMVPSARLEMGDPKF